jgi:signal transduction histidine kinase
VNGPQHRSQDDEPAPPREGRSRFRGVRSIRGRLMALLAVPTVALVLLGALGVLNQAAAYQAARTTESSVQLVLAEQSFVHELQRERGLSNGLLAGQVAFRTQLDGQRRRVDGARGDLERMLGGAEPAAAAAVREALGRLTGLGDQRAQVDSGAVGRAQSLAFYTGAITALTAATARGPQDESDALLSADLDALNALGAAKEATALERGFLNGVFSAGRFEGQDYATFSEIRGNRLAGFTAFRAKATAAQQASLDAALSSGPATTARSLEQRAIDAPTAETLEVDPSAWWTSMTRLVDDLRGVQQQVGADAAARAAGLRTAAITGLVLDIVLAIGALIAAAGLSVIAARSITRPLRRLADDARDAATVRLPRAVARIQGDDPSPEDSWRGATAVALEGRDDEIAEVARALTDVQRTAVELAGEQAVLRRNAAESMASLARRNQNLLRRQLGFITQLEREEEDADALAHLFELDHLATRMRRNAESLLVLIGESSPRRWSEPVPVGDVIRAALSEVEDYQRVTARRLDDAMIVGAAGTELAHLLAELLENALSFSPPNVEVEVYGQLSDDSTYVIAIVDHGIGMPADELAGANARLSGSETFLVAPTRYLGHYVIGRLAHPLGIGVSLRESPLTGVTARVVLPATLIAERGPAIAELVGSAASPAPRPRPARAGREETPAAVAVLDPPDAPPPTPDGARTHTRNGLVKRVRPTPAAPPPTPVADDPVTAVPEEAARRSRASVNAFRAGFSGRKGEGSPDGHDQ